MRITRSSVLTCLALLALVGCEKVEETTNDENGRLAPSAQDKRPAVSTNDAILSVNGIAYAQADWDADIALRETLYMHKVGKKATRDEKKRSKQREGLKILTLSSFINETIWRGAVGETGAIVRTSEAYACARTNVQTKYAKTFALPNETFDSLVALLPNLKARQRFENVIKLEAEQDAYCRTYFHDDYVVTSNLVNKTLKDIAKMNALVPVTNAQIYATASNLVLKARAGADFAKLADQYSLDEQKEPGGALGECDQANFPLDGEKLWPIFKKMKAGDVTDVLDTEDGICIYRCNKVVHESETTGELALDLSRIVLYRALPYPEMSFQQCQRALEKESRQEVMEKIIGDTRKHLKIEVLCKPEDLPKGFVKRFKKFISKKEEQK